jgi:hypothetical protein
MLEKSRRRLKITGRHNVRFAASGARGEHKVVAFRARNPHMSNLPARLKGYAMATKKFGEIPTRGTELYRAWLKMARRRLVAPRLRG